MHLGRSFLVPSRFFVSHHKTRETYLWGIFLFSYAYVPAERDPREPLFFLSRSRSEYLAVVPFASVNHGLNKIAYPRESNEMSAPGPPPSPRLGPNCSYWLLPRLPLVFILALSSHRHPARTTTTTTTTDASGVAPGAH